MKIKQKWCKHCIYYWRGDCAILVDTKIKKEYPCGKITYSFPLIKEIKKLGGKIFTKEWTCFTEVGCYKQRCKNFVDPCSINKGNCKFYKKKRYLFWIK